MVFNCKLYFQSLCIELNHFAPCNVMQVLTPSMRQIFSTIVFLIFGNESESIRTTISYISSTCFTSDTIEINLIFLEQIRLSLSYNLEGQR